MNNKIKVSVIIPCLNEEENIIRCLNSIAESTYPKHLLEIIIIDGLSQDNTIPLINNFKLENDISIEVYDNIKKQQNFALNIGIKKAKGDMIIRLDTHATIDSNYIKDSVEYLFEKNTGADAVGSPILTKPIKNTLIGRCIAVVMSSKFGVGNSSFRTDQSSKNKYYLVDTIPFGCYKKTVFDEIGNYNEKLFCSEDLDFHARMRKKGKKLFLNTGILNTYYCRYKYIHFIKHAFRNGIWSILPMSITESFIFSIRHLIPITFTSSLVALSILSLWLPFFKYLLFLEVALYSSLAIIFSLSNAIEHKNIFYFITLPILYFTLHFCYGLGSLSVLDTLFFKNNK